MRSCLVIDDSKVIRKFARSIVEELGFEVSEAADGKEALEICSKSIPDVILLDWNMPVMDGMEFLKGFKDKYAGVKTRVIFCTTENEVAKIKTAVTAGADEYIMKPFDAEIVKGKFVQLGLIEQ
ncbi:MAG: response regulator [Alphaproteobacteria bacterium]|nr:response regulator [Alphaproteobacteria bacterium]OJV15091.1 MAG: two-component system response regulator [Alphaproteobacteria bacterium 33-17]